MGVAVWNMGEKINIQVKIYFFHMYDTIMYQ